MIQTWRKAHIMQLSRLQLILLIFIATTSSALAVQAQNCSMAQARHGRHVHRDHGDPGRIIPVAQPTSASNIGSVDQPTSTPTIPPFTIPSSAPAVPSTSTMPTSVAVAISVSGITMTPLTMSEPITSTPTLAPLSAPLGTIVSMSPILTSTDSTVTLTRSNFGSLEHSTSTIAPSTIATSNSTTNGISSVGASSQALPFILVGAFGIALGLFGFGLTVLVWLRGSARRARARALRREVELMEVTVPRQVEAVRDDILNKRIPRPRNSLEEIIAAAERIAAQERSPALERNLANPVEDVGQSFSRKEDEDRWETLPPYVR